jgi:hypothetical protein
MKKEYAIETIEDLLEIPPERIDDCLKDFRSFYDFCQLMKNIKKHAELSPDDMQMSPVFNWIDDGKTDGFAKFHDIETGDLITRVKIK